MLENGRYEIERVLSVGDVWTSFVAWDHHLHMRVSIKRLQRRHPPALRERLVREVRALRSVSHPNVLRSYEFFDHDGQPSLVMEYLEGRPLDLVLQGHDHDPIQLALLIAGTASGLHALHCHGFVHENVAPQNILLDVCCRGAVLTEPGMTGAAHRPAELASYASPEKRDDRLVGPPSDVYSLALVLQETLHETAAQHGLEELIAWCLKEAPAERPTAHEMSREIRMALGEKPPSDQRFAVAAQPSVLVCEDGTFLTFSDGRSINLARRKTLQRLLSALAHQRAAHPEVELSVASLIEAGWPGQRLLRGAAQNRLYVGLSTLRNLGLGDLIERRNAGYRLSPSVRVSIQRTAACRASAG
jgi:hypothetical protein